MKKLLLSGLALTVCLSSFAQSNLRQIQSRLNESIRNQVLPMAKPTDSPVIPFRSQSVITNQSRATMTETQIGTTVYDLQSNYGTMGNRLFIWDDNTISAVWTKGDTATAYPDRGTGYNYFDGTTWGAIPVTRQESFRCGWPNVGGTGSGPEHIISHTPVHRLTRAAKGSGAWTEVNGTTIPAPGGPAVTWPRLAVGGANGTTLHVIGNENTGAFYMTYSRSLDGGATWTDLNVLLPDMATLHFEGSVDGYEVVAKGDVVAVIMGGWNESLTMWKSTDNGGTWTHTTINEFPLAPWDYVNTISDVDGDGVADTIVTTGSDISAVIDNNNQVHVAVGLMRVLGDTPGSYSYFPGTDGLLYWNESMGANSIINNVIAGIEDTDGDGVITIAPDIAIYQATLTGMPAIGVDAQNNVHLAYSSLVENSTNGGATGCEMSYRNVYYMYSTDGGANWAVPTVVEGSPFDEMVWPNMTKRVTNCVHLTYFKDGTPGNSFQPTGNTCHVAGANDIIYTCVTNPVGLNEVNSNVASVSFYPNPVASVLNVEFILDRTESVTIEMVDVLGQVAYSTSLKASTGSNNHKINVKNLASGIYSLNIVSGNSVTSNKVVIR